MRSALTEATSQGASQWANVGDVGRGLAGECCQADRQPQQPDRCGWDTVGVHDVDAEQHREDHDGNVEGSRAALEFGGYGDQYGLFDIVTWGWHSGAPLRS